MDENGNHLPDFKVFQGVNWKKEMFNAVRKQLEVEGCKSCGGRAVYIAAMDGDNFLLNCVSCALVGLHRKRFDMSVAHEVNEGQQIRLGERIAPKGEAMAEGNRREQVDALFIEKAVQFMQTKMTERLQKEGQGTFASDHEAMGVILEKIGEYSNTIRARDSDACYERLADIAVEVLFAMGCHLNGGILEDVP